MCPSRPPNKEKIVMCSVHRVLLVSSFFVAQSLLACGGSAVDSSGNPSHDESAGEASHGGRDGNDDTESGGEGPHSAGAPGAGSGSAGSGTSSHGAGRRIESWPERHTAVRESGRTRRRSRCAKRIRDSISDRDLTQMLEGLVRPFPGKPAPPRTRHVPRAASRLHRAFTAARPQ